MDLDADPEDGGRGSEVPGAVDGQSQTHEDSFELMEKVAKPAGRLIQS